MKGTLRLLLLLASCMPAAAVPNPTGRNGVRAEGPRERGGENVDVES